MKLLMAIAASLAFSGCMSTKMILSPKFDSQVKPAYVDNTDYWWWGLAGQSDYNLQKICVDQKPYAFQVWYSPEDAVIAVFTLGIYRPQTIRVWCGN